MKLRKGNDTVQNIVLYQYKDYPWDHIMLHALGEGIGNLGALQVLTIHYVDDDGRHEEGNDDHVDSKVVESLNWQAFADALGRVHHPIEVSLEGGCWEYIEDFTGFTKAIQGLSTIGSFRSNKDAVQWRFADTFMSVLASLPSL
jgi:hypothetical protein